MQCRACHHEVGSQSAFCDRCGAPLPPPAAGAVSPGTASPPSRGYPAPPPIAGAGLSDRAVAAIAYITIIPAIVFLFLEPYNRMPLVRFHSWQSIGLCIAAFVLHVIISVAQILMHFIPGIFLIFGLMHLAVGVALFCVWLLAIVQAAKGIYYKLPVIGDFAERQANS